MKSKCKKKVKGKGRRNGKMGKKAGMEFKKKAGLAGGTKVGVFVFTPAPPPSSFPPSSFYLMLTKRSIEVIPCSFYHPRPIYIFRTEEGDILKIAT